ncbi:cytochrome P450 [Variovorax sp. LjRoot175]|uniref:hypothetical protein n=1 Tax=Variovorax sp. LjRoot175 TaxID=3342276 RepID=UPI003ED0531F
MRDPLFCRALTWLKYRGVSTMIHQPRLLRLISRTVQRQPWIGRLIKVVASRSDVVKVFERPLTFSSTAHRPNLVAGEFVIGMESGPRHAAERGLLHSRLPPGPTFEKFATSESRRRIDALRAGPASQFDLIEDFMVPVAWQAIGGSFGARLPSLTPGDPMFMHLRHIGAHLVVGSVTTEAAQRRARESAAALNAWVRSNIGQLHQAWGGTGAPSREDIARNVVGLLWVGHPATVQSGALIMQEFLSRRSEPKLRDLVNQVQAHPDPWQDLSLRLVLKDHVLELLRFRPPFPTPHRDVRRNAIYGEGGKGCIAAGSVLTMLSIGAMFDPAAMPDAPPADYEPGRLFVDQEDRSLIFGYGARRCIARDQVVEILTSAFLGLLRLPGLAWADPWWRRIGYDGPSICSMRLKFRNS